MTRGPRGDRKKRDDGRGTWTERLEGQLHRERAECVATMNDPAATGEDQSKRALVSAPITGRPAATGSKREGDK